MLVVSRKVGERVLIGDQISVTVIKVGSGGVRIGIQAPKEMAVVREELAKQVCEAEQRTIREAENRTIREAEQRTTDLAQEASGDDQRLTSAT